MKIALQILWESAVINDYLDEVYPDKKLSPDDPYEKARQKIILERWGKVRAEKSQSLYETSYINHEAKRGGQFG